MLFGVVVVCGVAVEFLAMVCRVVCDPLRLIEVGFRLTGRAGASKVFMASLMRVRAGVTSLAALIADRRAILAFVLPAFRPLGASGRFFRRFVPPPSRGAAFDTPMS